EDDPFPSSIAAGNFDGDANGNVDIVVVEPGLSTSSTEGIHYYFGNGDGTFQTGGTHITLDQPTGRVPHVVTTGCFNNDNVVDVAVSCDDAVVNNSSAQVITSNGSGGFNPQIPLLITETDSALMAGIDAADFDKQGGDDIIMLGEGTQNGQEAFIFMNSIETPAAEAGPDQTSTQNTPMTLSGASCSISPVDSNNPAQFAIQWTVTNAPAGATPTLSGATTLTPTFQTATPGTYTLQLDCLTRCKDHVTDTMQITVSSLCGNGNIDPGEQCEPPNTATCDANCQSLAICGNGILEPGEECDDGNLDNNDACSSLCLTLCVAQGSGCGDDGPDVCGNNGGLGIGGGASLIPTGIHPSILAQWLATFALPGAAFAGFKVRRRLKKNK